MKRAGERLAWLDAAKGLGIILVVAGHVWTRGATRDAIYAFHMPLFFLLAGYSARPRPQRDAIPRLWSSLMVPYFAFLAVLMAADPLIEFARGHRPMFGSIEAALRAAALGGTELRGPLTVFWFVPCLFFARVAQIVLASFWPDPRDWRWAATMAISLAAGLWVGGHNDFSPLGLLSVPVALVFLWLGAVWRSLSWGGWLSALCVPAAAALLSRSLVPLNMKVGDYGTPGWSLIVAIVLSLALCGVARIVPLRPFRALGRMSLVVMFLHVPLIHYLTPYAGKPVLWAVATLVPVLAFFALERTEWGRRWFLGGGRQGGAATQGGARVDSRIFPQP